MTIYANVYKPGEAIEAIQSFMGNKSNIANVTDKLQRSRHDKLAIKTGGLYTTGPIALVPVVTDSLLTTIPQGSEEEVLARNSRYALVTMRLSTAVRLENGLDSFSVMMRHFGKLILDGRFKSYHTSRMKSLGSKFSEVLDVHEDAVTVYGGGAHTLFGNEIPVGWYATEAISAQYIDGIFIEQYLQQSERNREISKLVKCRNGNRINYIFHAEQPIHRQLAKYLTANWDENMLGTVLRHVK